MANTRIVAALLGNGHIGLVEQDVPPLKPGTVLVDVRNSLVSPGTELGGWRGLRRQLDHPDPNAKPHPFGYSNAGVVAAVGEGVSEFAVGDRVACIGAGYAMHTDVAVVPHHLCVKLPESVSFAQGSYAMLAATALQALRRLAPEFGEYTCVVGLGIVGQLTAQLLRLAGTYVIGWDTIALRNEIAHRCGIDATARVGADDEVAATGEFTDGGGLDAAVLAFGGDANTAMASVEKSMKVSPDGHPMGRIVVVGGPRFEYTSTLTNLDIRRASRTGPGYHDEAWEFGAPYPPVFMRWTTRTNLELCMRLIGEGRLKVDALTTHLISLRDVDKAVAGILDDPDALLGVVFEMSS